MGGDNLSQAKEKENWSEEALKYLRAKRERLDELIREVEMVNGYAAKKADAHAAAWDPLQEGVNREAEEDEKYLAAIREAKSHADAARAVMGKLGKAGYHDLARDFKRAGRRVLVGTLRSTLLQLKDAKRVSKGVYALK